VKKLLHSDGQPLADVARTVKKLVGIKAHQFDDSEDSESEDESESSDEESEEEEEEKPKSKKSKKKKKKSEDHYDVVS
jgi:hypothetical protein